ncbi:unnamed protein product [Amoebophrya sp. A120]|nr:unnamed protein product [Amoebophrya sp. A120]|eukprot:GSA120T00018022001.1
MTKSCRTVLRLSLFFGVLITCRFLCFWFAASGPCAVFERRAVKARSASTRQADIVAGVRAPAPAPARPPAVEQVAEADSSSFYISLAPGLIFTEVVEDFEEDANLLAAARNAAKPTSDTKSIDLSNTENSSGRPANSEEVIEERVLLIQFLNAGFLSMTKSWICNVERLATSSSDSANVHRHKILDRTLFVATDEKAFEGLHQFKPGGSGALNVFRSHTASEISKASLEYGKFGYFRLMEWRTKTLRSLLTKLNAPALMSPIGSRRNKRRMQELGATATERKQQSGENQHQDRGERKNIRHSIFLIESDAVWLRDPLPYIFQKTDKKKSAFQLNGSDIIAINDSGPGERPMANGGFLLLRGTDNTIRLWEALTALQERKLDRARVRSRRQSSKAIEDGGNEQLMLKSLLASPAFSTSTKLRLLPGDLFLPGKMWYDNPAVPDKSLTVPRVKITSSSKAFTSSTGNITGGTGTRGGTKPYVILNNWIRGVKKKIDRAQKHQHWFYDEENDRCLHTYL